MRLRHGQEAVSPVIGVILMIAITVVVAGVLFVIVKQVGDTNTQAPSIQFVRDNQNGQLTVVKAFRPFDLTEIEVRAGSDAKFGYNVAPSTNLPANTFVPFSTTSGQDLVGGDQVNFCSVSPGAKVDFIIRVTNPKNIVVYQNFFTNLRPCT